MPDSIRQQIMDALVVRLRTILTADGYETNLGLNITEWRTTDVQVSELTSNPVADVRDVSESVVISGGNEIHSLEVEITAYVLGSTMQTGTRDVIADIDAAIGTDPTFDGLVQKLPPVGNESVRTEQKDRKVGSVDINLTLDYVTGRFSPFALAG